MTKINKSSLKLALQTHKTWSMSMSSRPCFGIPSRHSHFYGEEIRNNITAKFVSDRIKIANTTHRYIIGQTKQHLVISS
jgi:hypothetical protein